MHDKNIKAFDTKCCYPMCHFLLNVCYAECHKPALYDECRHDDQCYYADYCYAECRSIC
jgi:hypothetical protein